MTSSAHADALLDTAKDLFDQASKARDAKAFDECYARAKAAWAIQQHAKIAGLLGDCALQTERPAEAAQHLSFYLSQPPESSSPELTALLEGYLREAKTKVAIVTLESNVADARVEIDGEPSELGKPVYLMAGEHHFEASHPTMGYAEQRKAMQLNTEQVIRLDLSPSGSSPADDVTPIAPPDDGPDALPFFLLSGGTALVGLGVTLGLAVAANGKSSDVIALGKEIDSAGGSCPGHAQCDALADAQSSRDGLSNASLVTGLISGVASGVFLTIGIVIASSSSEQASGAGSNVAGLRAAPTQLVPIVSPDQAGLMLTSAF